MVEGHITDPAGVKTMRRFLAAQYRLPHQLTPCPQHRQEVSIRDEGRLIVVHGCCREAVNHQLEQIARVVDWLEFCQSLNTPD